MRGKRGMLQCRRWQVLIMLGLGLLGAMNVASVATAQTAGAICTIRIFGNGDIMSVFTLPPTNFAVSVLVPADNDVVVPVLCEDLGSIGLGVANQEKNNDVTFNVRVFDHDGISFCDKGSFTIRPRGGTGVTFASCPQP